LFENNQKGDRPFFAGVIALRDGYASRPLCNHRPLRWWKWIGLSVETGVGVTRGLSEYGRWAIDLFCTEGDRI
jgi:hypothetical protein